MLDLNLTPEAYLDLLRDHAPRAPRTCVLAVPLGARPIADQLTPVTAYRRLVRQDHRSDPSFLLESVGDDAAKARYSVLSARPMLRVRAHGHDIRIERGAETPDGGWDHGLASHLARLGEIPDGATGSPLDAMRRIATGIVLLTPPASPGGVAKLPAYFQGGWFGFAGYDSVRYGLGDKLPFAGGPMDDRGLADVDFGLYSGVVVFDHLEKQVWIVQLALCHADASPDQALVAYARARDAIAARVRMLDQPDPLTSMLGEAAPGPIALRSNLTREEHAGIVVRAKEYIRAGDIFQVVLGQRFEHESSVDPFDAYRALRHINPSPYLVYMQTATCILAGSSPEILCRVRREQAGPTGVLQVTNRPLAGTRRRGATAQEDVALERELLADPKERAEHIMLVDLGRNDVGVVSQPGSIALPAVMQVERYSHVMHISSTVTGTLREGLDCWDALRAALPVGTISGAPKLRAMQIIDQLEPVRRGPYGGGMGYVSLDGQMDMALTLRTLVVPFGLARGLRADGASRWTYHLQSSGGIVADSDAQAEYAETVNKAGALRRALEVAEEALRARQAGR